MTTTEVQVKEELGHGSKSWLRRVSDKDAISEKTDKRQNSSVSGGFKS